MLQVTAELVERRTTGPCQELMLHAPPLAAQLKPGRPVLVRAGWGQVPYLRRTFYPVALAAETWTIRVPADGDWGHAWLAAAPLGTGLDCLGPVGNGYHIPSVVRNVLCVGEGAAAWVLLPALAQAVALGTNVALAAVVLRVRDAIPADRLPPDVEYHLVSAAATRGRGDGLADLLPELLRWAELVLAAGSMAFYAALSEAVRDARFRLDRGFIQVLHPAPILCGTGACQACAADVAGGRRRVCQRGPVFDLADLQS